MRSKSLRTMVVLAQNSCIIKNMHYHVMHYEQVNCMSDIFDVALVWVCMREGGKLRRTIKGLKQRGGRSIFFVRRIDSEWGFEVLVSPDLTD